MVDMHSMADKSDKHSWCDMTWLTVVTSIAGVTWLTWRTTWWINIAGVTWLTQILHGGQA